MKREDIPVITIDGPAGSGKGTLSIKLANQLGWHLLDSGLLYRALALSYVWYINEKSIDQHAKLFFNTTGSNDLINESKDWGLLSCDNVDLSGVESIIASLALNLKLVFKDQEAYLIDLHEREHKVTRELRSEFCGNLASKLAAIPVVRTALLSKQTNFLQWPGLVADGRDLGTVVFPKAKLKIFLDADPNVRTLRRQIQLKETGVDGNLYNRSTKDLFERDLRDRERIHAPLKPAKDAFIVDTTNMTIEEVFNVIMKQVNLIILR